MIAEDHLDTLNPEQLREALRVARAEMARKDEALLSSRRSSTSSRTRTPCSSD